MSMKVNVLTQELWVLSVLRPLVLARLDIYFPNGSDFHAHFGRWALPAQVADVAVPSNH
jgi:hypothetical protein